MSPFFLGSLCYCKHPWLEAVRCSEELSVGCLQRQAATVVPGCASPLRQCRLMPVCFLSLWEVTTARTQTTSLLSKKKIIWHTCSPCWNLFEQASLKTKWWDLSENQALLMLLVLTFACSVGCLLNQLAGEKGHVLSLSPESSVLGSLRVSDSSLFHLDSKCCDPSLSLSFF